MPWMLRKNVEAQIGLGCFYVDCGLYAKVKRIYEISAGLLLCLKIHYKQGGSRKEFEFPEPHSLPEFRNLHAILSGYP